MDSSFYTANREALYRFLPDHSLAVVFAGHAPRKSSDTFYHFHASRNFVYLTGIGGGEAQGLVLMAEKRGEAVAETLFLAPPDERAETWSGPRIRPQAAKECSGIGETRWLDEFPAQLHRAVQSGGFDALYLDLFKLTPGEAADETHRFAHSMAEEYPGLLVRSLHPQLRRQRTIKSPGEVEAIRGAVEITKKGILAMMRSARPGITERELKGIFDQVLTNHGVFTPSHSPIISAGENNFCIHYDRYTGQANDGDMVLNDVGACWDDHYCDISRGWPVNGRFSEKQRLLYECAYRTSEHMFSLIRPGMPMQDVDAIARRANFEQLREIGLCQRFEDAGKYIWHGGAHHIGLDVHDAVDLTMSVAPGMVFCVDIGIYCREWGIGFRLEDNCLVTEDGCVNLTADVPRSVGEIETAMAQRTAASI